MINLDDRLIKEVSPKIKPNALSVLLAIAIHLNKQSGRCFPSHRRLMDLTGLGRDAVYTALEVLKNEGLLKSFQSVDSKTKTFGRRTFTVSTRFISIFVTAEDAEPLPENPDTAQPDTAQPDTANQETYLLNEFERLNEVELINQHQQTQIDVAVFDGDAGIVVFDSIPLEAEKKESPKVPLKGSFESHAHLPPMSFHPNMYYPDCGQNTEPQKTSAAPPRRFDPFDIDTAANELKADTLAWERYARESGVVDRLGFELAVSAFTADQKTLAGDGPLPYNNRIEFRKHFFNLVRRKAEIARSPGNQAQTRNGNGKANLNRLGGDPSKYQEQPLF